MMRRLLYLSLALLVSFSACKKKGSLHMVNTPEGRGIKKAEASGVYLSLQSITFADTALVTVFEKLEELKIKNIEISPDHKIGGKWGEQKFDANLSFNDLEEIKEVANQHQIKIVGLGVFKTNQLNEWDKIFSFAQSVGVEYIIAEPRSEDLEAVNNLSLETGIKVGIHNNLQPSEYWSPSLFLDKTKNSGTSIGACADVANWNKEGLDQIECLEQLEGKIQSVHFKDIDYKRQTSEGLEYQADIIWGSGILDVDAMMIELKRQNYSGYITIKFEKKSERLMQELKDCIFYYDLVADEFL